MNRPLCFVLMPFGKKPDAAGALLDFDAVYRDLIAPAVDAADLEPLRADEELAGGLIHKAMFERLILCEYAVADLTTANANVFYELGIRHAVRPWTTVLMFAARARLPFDVAPLRALPYQVTQEGIPADVAKAREALVTRLRAARDPQPDSPIFQLIDGIRPPEVDHTKTDVFRDRVRYSARVKAELTAARRQGRDAVSEVAERLGPISDCEAGVVIDLFLSYRAVEAWRDMIALVDRMPAPLAATVIVQEQFALALNRAGAGDRAEDVLLSLIARRGPSSETYGILGRVYKDRWEAALRRGENHFARGLLARAIEAYLHGFETDWRDAYPGINAITLMEIADPPDDRRTQILPVVVYAVERKIAAGSPDYWDYATRLELAVLAIDEARALAALADALAAVREPWEPKTTARNLRLIREARDARRTLVPWAKPLEETLERRGRQ
jgi:hypothetical protein